MAAAVRRLLSLFSGSGRNNCKNRLYISFSNLRIPTMGAKPARISESALHKSERHTKVIQ